MNAACGSAPAAVRRSGSNPEPFASSSDTPGGAGDRAAYETLHEPADLHRWLRGFVEVAVAPVTDADLLQAQRLREGIWQCMDARADGTPLPRAHVEQVNRFALKPSLAPVLDAAGGRRWAEPASCDAVLSTLARDLIEVLTGPLGGSRPPLRRRSLPPAVRRRLTAREAALVLHAAVRQPRQGARIP